MNKHETELNETTTVEKMTYEQAFTELEEITRALESDEQSLDQALALFERGQALIQHCSGLLDDAELRVQQILGDDISEYSLEGD